MDILSRPENPKLVLWQTVKTQMKCRIMQHFIRVSTFCLDKTDLQRNTIFLEIITCYPSIHVYIMDHPDLTVPNFVENSVALKRVRVNNNGVDQPVGI